MRACFTMTIWGRSPPVYHTNMIQRCAEKALSHCHCDLRALIVIADDRTCIAPPVAKEPRMSINLQVSRYDYKLVSCFDQVAGPVGPKP